MRKATILDTSVASTNIGDQIIMEAVRDQLADVLAGAAIHTVASHEYMGAKSRSLIRRSDFTIAGGTNLLSSHVWARSVWKLRPLDLLRCRNIVLMGCGWYQAQRRPDLYTRMMFRRILSEHLVHSVRDEYTVRMLASAGIENVVNTGCPTLWKLTPEHCCSLPTQKAEHVVTTLNTYIPSPVDDKRLLELLRRCYNKVYLWIQTDTDYEYARGLDQDLLFVDPSLRAYDALLNSPVDLDYIGTRLHAGIRAIQAKRRTLILEIDNRAREMAKDFHLPTVERNDLDGIERFISDPFRIAVKLPTDRINRWRSQFSECLAEAQ